MRKIVIFIFSLFLFANFLLAQNDSIYVVVDGPNATIWQTNTQRNCGAIYQMDIVSDAYNISWYQIDTGATAYCICNFDLSVTIGPLEGGEYFVDVFSTDVAFPGDTIFQGTTSFTIGGRNVEDKINIIDEYQSDCYNYVNIKGPDINQDELLLLQNFPNPFSNKTTILYSVESAENAELIIYNCVGQIVRKFNCNNLIEGTIEWDGTNKLGKRVNPGLYFYQLLTPGYRVTKKMQLTK